MQFNDNIQISLYIRNQSTDFNRVWIFLHIISARLFMRSKLQLMMIRHIFREKSFQKTHIRFSRFLRRKARYGN